MSGPSAHERVKKLEARGVIRGYSALVDPTLLGYGVLAFIFIKQVPGTIATDMTGDFVGIDEIEECHHLAGEADYLLKVRATDTRHLERVLHSIQQVGARLHDRDPGRLLECLRDGVRSALAREPEALPGSSELVTDRREPGSAAAGARVNGPGGQPSGQYRARAERHLDVRLHRARLRSNEHAHDGGHGRSMAAGGRPRRSPVAGRVGPGRCLRHRQADRGAGRGGRAGGTRGRGRSLAGDAGRGQARLRRDARRSSSCSETPWPCRSPMGRSTRPRSPSGCATWPASKMDSARWPEPYGVGDGSSAWNCRCRGHGSWAGSTSASFRVTAPLIGAHLPSPCRLRLPAALAATVSPPPRRSRPR